MTLPATNFIAFQWLHDFTSLSNELSGLGFSGTPGAPDWPPRVSYHVGFGVISEHGNVCASCLLCSPKADIHRRVWEFGFTPIVGTSLMVRDGALDRAKALPGARRPTMRDHSASIAIFGVFADVLDRHHVFVVGGVEHDDALGRAAGDADALDRTADQLALVGHQHDLVAILDRE